ncbi:hypothetical protein [Novosphingobium humi]|uniref:Uncharacterized protein n=1 Tax=Novosphingobium humi TaxID=2282397 RepID=A0ABY7TYY9_9SPHN|nr:hypothetical protein [Novosphingobium humi]WCT77309.1 hypothetical protein PQ457_15545 [Novosphingobium humi]
MDGARSFFERNAGSGPANDEEEDDFLDLPPVVVAEGERRLQIRAYDHWTQLLGAKTMPLIADLKLDQIGDIATQAVLIDFAHSTADPRIRFVGEMLAQECGVARDITRLDQVPEHSMLARLTGQYMQIIANQAPIGFEEEFLNGRGAMIAYRGMLLPFAEELGGPIRYVLGVVNWKEAADASLSEQLARELGASFHEDEQVHAPRPSPEQTVAQWAAWADGPQAAGADRPQAAGADDPQAGINPAPLRDLADWLSDARAMAQAAAITQDRPRQALYDAIGRAYDFALIARDKPGELHGLMVQAGLVGQPRAPLVPIVKLVFGADHDKTRLTEYATALSHGLRLGLPRGAMADHLAQASGGLKGVVAQERRLRRDESAGEAENDNPLDRLTPRPLASLGAKGPEYAVVLVRRMADGTIALLGDLGDDPALMTRATRLLTPE